MLDGLPLHRAVRKMTCVSSQSLAREFVLLNTVRYLTQDSRVIRLRSRSIRTLFEPAIRTKRPQSPAEEGSETFRTISTRANDKNSTESKTSKITPPALSVGHTPVVVMAGCLATRSYDGTIKLYSRKIAADTCRSRQALPGRRCESSQGVLRASGLGLRFRV